jgi:Flp pilus assembly pilin Flp
MEFLLQKTTAALADYLMCDDGASAVEYALMLLVLGGCAAIVMHSLGRHLDAVFVNTATSI